MGQELTQYASRLMAWRRSRGLNIQTLSRLTDIPSRWLADVENGSRPLDVAIVVKLEAIFGKEEIRKALLLEEPAK